ncbi:MAG: alpha/beta fold hydrolase [Acidimicrobiales bacterium]
MIGHIACSDATLIPSVDGLTIAVHDFGGEGPPVLLSHATGFHAHCFEPMAAVLSPTHRCMGLDHRGYGDSENIDPAGVEWTPYGNDALAAARHLSAASGGAPVVGVGHSMGGASLLMAALREPQLFRALFVFEPIVFPPPVDDGPRPASPLPAGARKRRAVFASFDEALENFTAKPPMSSFHPVARAAYVRHGFAPLPDGSVTLKCLPDHEARTYETGATSGMFDRLPEVATPTWVMAGAPAPYQPSSFAATVAERLPDSTYVQWDEMGHFGPLEHPETIATFVQRTVAGLPR